MRYYLANANLFYNGKDSTGIVKMLDLDNVKANTEKYESLGMLIDKDVPVGFDQMAGKLTFAGPAPDLFGDAAFPWETTPFTILGIMTDKALGGSNNNKQLKVEMKIRPIEVGLGKYENQKLTEYERAFKVDTVTISMGGVEVLHVDSENNIWRVNGVDKWAAYRALLGQ